MMKIKFLTAGILLRAAALFVSACATPVGVRRVTPRAAYQDAQANPLGTGELSDETKVVLGRFDLQETFANDPENAIARLHEKALNDSRRDLRYALAEICYLYGGQLSRSFFSSSRKRGCRLFFDVRAYMPTCICLPIWKSRRPRLLISVSARPATCIIFLSGVRSLQGNGGRIEFSDGRRDLPVGSLAITLDMSHLPRGVCRTSTSLWPPPAMPCGALPSGTAARAWACRS